MHFYVVVQVYLSTIWNSIFPFTLFLLHYSYQLNPLHYQLNQTFNLFSLQTQLNSTPNTNYLSSLSTFNIKMSHHRKIINIPQSFKTIIKGLTIKPIVLNNIQCHWWQMRKAEEKTKHQIIWVMRLIIAFAQHSFFINNHKVQ